MCLLKSNSVSYPGPKLVRTVTNIHDPMMEVRLFYVLGLARTHEMAEVFQRHCWTFLCMCSLFALPWALESFERPVPDCCLASLCTCLRSKVIYYMEGQQFSALALSKEENDRIRRTAVREMFGIRTACNCKGFFQHQVAEEFTRPGVDAFNNTVPWPAPTAFLLSQNHPTEIQP